MSETKEMQTEEREALASIYEGDGFFKQVNAETFQYKVGIPNWGLLFYNREIYVGFDVFQYGEEDGNKSFLLEICWQENYPNELPTINMDTFYNRNL